MLPGCCPSCGFSGEIEAFLVDPEARRAIARAAALEPAIGKLVGPYLRLFASGKRGMQLRRAVALIDELAALIVRQPLAVWVERFAGTDCCVTPVLGAHEALFGRAPVTMAEGMQRLTAPALTLR